MSKFDTQKVKEMFIRKLVEFPRMRSSIVKFLGQYYYKPYSQEQFKKIADELIIDLKDEPIHDEKQLAAYMAKL